MEKIRPGITGTSKKISPSLSAQESCHVELYTVLLVCLLLLVSLVNTYI
jgi:hypothetical protein